MGRTRLRRGLAVAAVTVTASLAGVAFAAGSDAGTPAPVVWRDHVVEPSTTTTP